MKFLGLVARPQSWHRSCRLLSLACLWLLLFKLLEQLSLILRVPLTLDFLTAVFARDLLRTCHQVLRRLQARLLLSLGEQLLDLKAQGLVLRDHLLDRQLQQQLVGVLDQVETLGLLLVLRLDEDAERLGREREEGLVVELGRLLVLALEQGLDALADLRREFP